MEKIIFINIGWMRNYKGLANDDITHGGSFVETHGYGNEIMNFLPSNGKMYGGLRTNGSININRLGASQQDESIKDVLTIWVSTSPLMGNVIIGWYKGATIYRNPQILQKNSSRIYKEENLEYLIEADVNNCKLLSIDERTFIVPRTGPGSFGRSNVWYASEEDNKTFRQNVLDFIDNGQNSSDKTSSTENGKSWQPDLLKRKKVEENAVIIASKYYEKLGYIVDSFEKDNVGWDLEATKNNIKLKLEVKGLSQETILIGLTPNEYTQMNKNNSSYRICVVSKALSANPILNIFSYSPETETWEDDMGNILKISESVSATMRVEGVNTL
jgi:predicted house-cleaning noncanonical NTP pyrophosphatase (MazG superfamily)